MSERASHGYCPSCKQESAIDHGGQCLWCGSPTEPLEIRARRRRRGGKPAGKWGKLTDAELRAIHHVHLTRGISLNRIAGDVWERKGFASQKSALGSISGGLKRLGLPARERIEATVLASTKHGRKSRNVDSAGERAYRRWLRDQRGWHSVHGPGQPLCKATKRQHPHKGEPCQRPAMEGSDYCQAHDPQRELARQAHLAGMRSRLPSREMVPVEPFAAWLRRRAAELGTLNAVAKRTGLAAAAYRYAKGGGAGLDGDLIGRAVVERALHADATTSFEELYGASELSEAA